MCEPDISGGLRPFWDRVAQAAAWCESHADPADPKNCLRSSALQPRLLQSSYASLVRGVAENRRHPPAGGKLDETKGRLLLYFPDAELSDGAAEMESGGFFDVFNAPPWDTWVALVTDLAAPEYFQAQLVAWVPDVFVPAASAGIDVNIDECVVWLDESSARFARLVAADRAAGKASAVATES